MILLGYADDRAQTAPVIVAGPEISRSEITAIFTAAKRSQQFPAGIARLELCQLTATDTAIAINQPKTKLKKK